MRLALAFITVLAACDVGEVGPAGGGQTDGGGSGSNAAAEMSFMTTMVPLINAKGCTAATGGTGAVCHGGGQPPNFSSFAMMTAGARGPVLISKPGMNSGLVIKAPVAPNLHNGVPYWDAGELTMVAAWIDSLP